MRRILLIGSALAMFSVTHVRAEGGAYTPSQVVALRKAMMDLQGGLALSMKTAVETGADVKQFKAGAQALEVSANQIVALFPPGTENVGDTKAKANIWTDHDTFAKDAQALHDAAAKLVSFAEADDKAGFAKQFANVGKACGACHRAFREKE